MRKVGTFTPPPAATLGELTEPRWGTIVAPGQKAKANERFFIPKRESPPGTCFSCKQAIFRVRSTQGRIGSLKKLGALRVREQGHGDEPRESSCDASASGSGAYAQSEPRQLRRGVMTVVPSKMLAVNARRKRLVAGLFFYPRGGSAQVVRSLGRVLPAAGWEAALVAGSLGEAGDRRHAPTFFRGLDVRSVDYSPAAGLGEPLVAGVPGQLSYEDRRGSADRVFARVDDAAYERLVAVWIEALAAGGAESADLLHFHHLTPLNEAAVRAFPHVPVVGQLHGTELAMLRVIEAGAPSSWTYAQQWAERMRRWARSCARLIVSSEAAARDALALLDAEPWRISIVPNGIDLRLFNPHVPPPPGIRRDVPVVLFLGRFDPRNGLTTLIESFKKVRSRHREAQLVVVGDGPLRKHYYRAAGGDPDISFVGSVLGSRPSYYAHSAIYACPTTKASFGITLLESMACETPVVCSDILGFRDVVKHEREALTLLTHITHIKH